MSTTQSIAQTDAAKIALYDVLHKTISQRGALCVLYSTGGTTEKARVIVPSRIEVGKYADRVIALDSIRRCELPFRMDRIVAYHSVNVEGARV